MLFGTTLMKLMEKKYPKTHKQKKKNIDEIRSTKINKNIGA